MDILRTPASRRSNHNQSSNIIANSLNLTGSKIISSTSRISKNIDYGINNMVPNRKRQDPFAQL